MTHGSKKRCFDLLLLEYVFNVQGGFEVGRGGRERGGKINIYLQKKKRRLVYIIIYIRKTTQRKPDFRRGYKKGSKKVQERLGPGWLQMFEPFLLFFSASLLFFIFYFLFYFLFLFAFSSLFFLPFRCSPFYCGHRGARSGLYVYDAEERGMYVCISRGPASERNMAGQNERSSNNAGPRIDRV